MIEVQRTKFIQLAHEYWAFVVDGNSKAANARHRAIDKLMATLTKNGYAKTLLLELVMENDEIVRLAAAGHLMNFEERDIATSILRELASDPTGFIAPMAVAILRANRISIT